MGRELPALCQVETPRLLWLMGVLFALIISFQYLELPYSISSMFSAAKIPLPTEKGTLEADPPLSEPTPLDNSTSFTSNSTPGPIAINGFDETGWPKAENSSETSGWISRNSTVEIAPTPGNAPKNETEEDGEEEEKVDDILENQGNPNGSDQSPSPSVPPTNTFLLKGLDVNASAPIVSVSHNESSGTGGFIPPTFDRNGKKEESQNKSTNPVDATNISKNRVPDARKRPGMTKSGIVSISEMNKLLDSSRASQHSAKPKWSSEVDEQLLYVKYEIENAPISKKDPVIYAPLYRNISTFKRSYELMEKMLKVYVYREGKRPIMHTPILKGIYASEGWFMKLLESNKDFVTKDPKKAHLFYLPFSSRMLEETLYVKDSHSHKNLIQYLKDYLNFISAKHPFWNRTSGADHFLVACHDWAPSETRRHMSNCIRALCNSDVKEGFVFGKDVSLPETYVRNSQNPLKDLKGRPSSKRPVLAFFAGSMHGYLRPILLSYWGDNKDPDMKIFGKLPKSKGNRNYIQFMKSSKYCICAKGYEVNSPRVVEAIYYECVPVIISDNFVPPFFEVLNWESFAVFVLEKDIPNLKMILSSISKRRYREMQMRVRKVQKHFLWHGKPEKYDIFHMILHSVWYNRVMQI